MVFNKSNRLRKKNKGVYYEGNAIEAVSQYTYVGIVFTPNRKFKQNQFTLKNKAMKALFSIKKSILSEKMLSPKLCLKIFDSLIVPILSYASEIWATEITSTDNCLEGLCMSYYRFILGVSKCTPLEGIRAELGRFPLKINLYMSVIKYWCRLNSLPGDHILKQALQENIDINSPWANFILCNLGSYNHMNVFNSLRVTSYAQLNKKLKRKLSSEYLNTWRENMSNDTRKNGGGNKLRTYRTFKTAFYFEKYLHDLSNFTLRRTLSKFRLSDHSLNIELGRKSKPKLPLKDRLCLRCDSNEIDDEFHLLFSCKKFITERVLLLQKSGIDYSTISTVTQKEMALKRVVEYNFLDLAVFLKNTDLC